MATLFKMASKLNVQNFPRPPLCERTARHLQVKWQGQTIADTKEAFWVLETYHAPSKLFRWNSFGLWMCILIATPMPSTSQHTSNISQHTTSRNPLFPFRWRLPVNLLTANGKGGQRITASMWTVLRSRIESGAMNTPIKGSEISRAM